MKRAYAVCLNRSHFFKMNPKSGLVHQCLEFIVEINKILNQVGVGVLEFLTLAVSGSHSSADTKAAVTQWFAAAPGLLPVICYTTNLKTSAILPT